MKSKMRIVNTANNFYYLLWFHISLREKEKILKCAWFNLRLLIVIISIWITISCSSRENNLYRFDPKNIIDQKIKLSDIAEDIKYIPLDSKFPFQFCLNFHMTNKSIYISTNESGILAFDRDGKMAKKVGSRGRGPGEYDFGINFTVNNGDEKIYILNITNKEIKVYSQGGSFIKDISLQSFDSFFNDIRFYGENLLVSQYPLGGMATYNWIIIDTLGILKSKKMNSIPSFNTSRISKGGIFNYNDKISYWNEYNDTVFSISPDLTYKTLFLFAQGSHRAPTADYLSDGKRPNDFMLIYSILETNHFWILRYFDNTVSKAAFAIIDKRNQHQYLVNIENPPGNFNGGIINDLDGGTMFQPLFFHEENGQEYLINIIEPFYLKSYVASDTFKFSNSIYPEKKKDLEILANNLQETDNPVLVMVKLKK